MAAKYVDIFGPKCVVILRKEWEGMEEGCLLRNGCFSGYPFYPISTRFANYVGVTNWFSPTLPSRSLA